MNDDKSAMIFIFGASGDLTRRKLIPALYNTNWKGRGGAAASSTYKA